MNTTTEQNKRLVWEAFDTLFNKRDYAAAEKLWSPHYIQHSAHIGPRRPVQLGQDASADAQVRARNDRGGRRLRDRPRTLFGFSTGELDCCRYSSNQGWNAGRALGCDPRRGDSRRVQEQSSDVRHELSDISRPHQPSMTLRIERSADQGGTTIRLIGRMQAEHVSEVERQIEESGAKVTLDLEEVTLVDVPVVRFLGTCEIRGISILNCSPYITDWIAKERR